MEENEGDAGENVVTFARDPRAGATQIKIEEVGGSERETHHKEHRVVLLFSHPDDIYSCIKYPVT